MTAIEDVDEGQVPNKFSLNQNYPNPFNPSTTISYSLSKAADVNLTIHNILGQPVKTLVTGNVPAGSHTAQWDGTNAAGNKVVSGVYFYKLEAENQSKTMKMLLLK